MGDGECGGSGGGDGDNEDGGWEGDVPMGSPTLLKRPPEPFFSSCSSFWGSVWMCCCCGSSLSDMMNDVGS